MNSSQRSYLKKEAHHLKPVVMVGQQGVTEAVVAAAEQALASHELIKIRFVDYKDDRRNLGETLSAATGSQLVSIIGNVVTLYREARDPAERRYRLPK